MPQVRANGIDIEYETFGDPKAAPLLLVSGLGAQMIGWDEGLCESLAAGGFHVIRFDNRDAGLSTKMVEAGPSDLVAAQAGDIKPAYRLEDMADDAVALLDALQISASHIVGSSMGGFISQLIALNHPARVLSLTLIMSGASGKDAVRGRPEAAQIFTTVPGPTREERIAHAIANRRILTGAGNPFDDEYERRRAERLYDRSYYPAGLGRQLLASIAAPSRLDRLPQVAVPALVIHGLDDPLLPIENGRRIAAAIPGARLREVEGMGHNVPVRYWRLITDAIIETARNARPLQPGAAWPS
jgi:pimeloyl-ACP methyl ester carboxylesterase